jgi:hypothetical protein
VVAPEVAGREEEGEDKEARNTEGGALRELVLDEGGLRVLHEFWGEAGVLASAGTRGFVRFDAEGLLGGVGARGGHMATDGNSPWRELVIVEP